MSNQSRSLLEIGFIMIFVVQLVSYSRLSCNAFKGSKEMQNIFNYVQTCSIVMFLVVRIASLVYIEVFDDDLKSLNKYLQEYMMFQIPQDLLNFAILGQFFSWADVILTFKFVLQN